MNGSVCALGFFDGVHEAHRQILLKCVAYAKEHSLKSIALTFEKSPAEYFGKKIEYLTSLDHKKEIMYSLGIDEVVALSCNEDILFMTASDFVEKILVEKLNAKILVCGFNYTFGKNAEGNTILLSRLAEKHNIRVIVTDCMSDCGITVSSTEIRNLLSKGDIENANKLLSRPFEVRGTVSDGKRLGRRIGFPTANIYPENLPSLPHGVYATKTSVNGNEYISVTNVGINPTVNDNSLRIETHIVNFTEDIYNLPIKIKFFTFLRPEKKFLSIDALKAQISIDKENAISFFSTKDEYEN